MSAVSDERKFVRHNLYRCVLIKGEQVRKPGVSDMVAASWRVTAAFDDQTYYTSRCRASCFWVYESCCRRVPRNAFYRMHTMIRSLKTQTPFLSGQMCS